MDELRKSNGLVSGRIGQAMPVFMGANGREFTNPFSKNFFNLTGTLLTQYNTCKTAYTAWAANKAAYDAFQAAVATWTTNYNNAGCTSLVAPPAPNLQIKVSGTDPCAVAANSIADQANSQMTATYNSLKSAYDAKVANCASIQSQHPQFNGQVPTAFDAGTYITVTPSAALSFDGEPQYMNAAGLDLSIGRKFQNAAGLDVSVGRQYRNACPACAAAMFAADGDEVANTGWMKYAVLAVGVFFMVKLLKK